MTARARFALVAAVALCAGPARAVPDAASLRFAGSYRYVGGEAEVRDLDAAIEAVVQQMNFLIRGIARRRLRAPNLPSAGIDIAIEGGLIRVSRPGHPTVSAPADGATIEWKSPEGDVFAVSHGFEGGAMYQRFRDQRSESLNRFRLSDDGKRLTIETTIVARRLPAPLRFRTTYERR